ncbi:MAG TPA: M23 family metallopeptidase [Thermoanaerobaculia bacterium]|nr:M23 family metallopeptidase [Thermoanaerobaculia bacterium]
MPMRRLALFLALLVAASLSYAPEAPGLDPVIYPMIFPVAGEHRFSRDFGDPRGRARSHTGIDIVAEKMTPVVAVADGTVRWIHGERGGECCALSVVHDDGWRSRYIHLNNDTPGTDDGQGYGIARGLRLGSRVRAGQVIGFVGDSGNAEETVPHLHFELLRPDGSAVDVFDSLQAALADPRTSPAPRIAGPPIGPFGGRVRAQVRRPAPDPAAPGGELPVPVGAEAPGEPGEGAAEALPVTPFLPVPADECSGGFEREIALAEVAKPRRLTLSCFSFDEPGE